MMNTTALAIIQPDELDTILLTESDIARFWKRVDKGKQDDCWVWQGYKDKAGYGKFQLNHVPIYTHRVAYTIANGAIPVGRVVCHHCDNPSCCNPTHLFAGTQAENIADRDRKGHTPFQYGHNNAASKLTESQVREIRQRHANGAKQNVLAAEFGMSKTQINKIVHGQRWTWVK